MAGIKRQDFEPRFWSLVNKTDGCWEWQGSVDSKGYGRIYFRAFRHRAHRVSYILTYSEIPDDLHVCHSCDNALCVRPDHLFLGTHQQNMADKMKKGRGTPPPLNIGDANWMRKYPERVRRGEKHPNAKLSFSVVSSIRKDYQSGQGSLRQLGAKYKLSYTHISKIVNNIIWKE